MKIKKLQWVILAVCILQLLGLYLWGIRRGTDILQVEYNGSKLYFYYRCMDRLYSDGDNIQINSYLDEDTGEFYLFFPGDFQGRTSRLLLYGADELVVDQAFYRTDDSVGFLQEGRYSVAIGGNFYVLNVMYGGKLPGVFINLDTGNMDFVHENKENSDTGSFNMYDAGGKLRYSGALLSMHGRGNYSWLYHRKKGYAVSLAAKGALLAGAVSDKWNLIGSSYDPYLIKNKIVYDLAANVNLEYTPETEYIELFVCGDYLGTYLLSNKVRIGEDSVDIDSLEKRTEAVNAKLPELYEPFQEADGGDVDKKGYLIPENPADITGGYLIEQEIYDRYIEEPSGFRTKSGNNYVVQSPEYASLEQLNYIQDYMQGIENALSDEDGMDPETGKHISDYIDMESFVKDYLIQEIPKNYDMNVTSQYFYKPRGSDSLLYAGPVWDFDNSMGTSSNRMGGNGSLGTRMDDPKDLLALYYFVKEDCFSFASLYLHDEFREQAVRLYYESFQPELDELLSTGLADYEENLGNSVRMNQARWSLDKDFASEIWNIRDFLTKRMEYFGEVWENPGN